MILEFERSKSVIRNSDFENLGLGLDNALGGQ